MIKSFADWLIFELLAFNAETSIGKALHFFCYDSIKIILLLFTITIVMGIVNAYFPIERLREYLIKHNLWGFQYLLTSLFGAITPFCSCSSIPLFIGFVRGGIPLGITFSFLITSPLINEVAIAMFAGIFGWRITLIYLVSGLLLGMIGGFLLGKLKLERFLSKWVIDLQRQSSEESATWIKENRSFQERFPTILKEAFQIVKSVLPYLIIGISIGAIMHGYVPENFFENYLSKDNIFAVPAAIVLAVPMYINAAGILPIIEVFVAKGIPLGTALAFMMAVVGLSLPEAMLLKKVMNWRLIGIFFGTISLFIIILGYLFNAIL